MKIRSIVLGALGATVMFMTTPAFAIRGSDAGGLAAIRQALDNPNTLKLVRVQGALSCELAAQNDGQSCALKIKESGSGRIYNLVEARTAMQLYLDGARNVIIEGRMEGSEAIEVRTASIANESK